MLNEETDQKDIEKVENTSAKIGILHKVWGKITANKKRFILVTIILSIALIFLLKVTLFSGIDSKITKGRARVNTYYQTVLDHTRDSLDESNLTIEEKLDEGCDTSFSNFASTYSCHAKLNLFHLYQKADGLEAKLNALVETQNNRLEISQAKISKIEGPSKIANEVVELGFSRFEDDGLWVSGSIFYIPSEAVWTCLGFNEYESCTDSRQITGDVDRKLFTDSSNAYALGVSLSVTYFSDGCGGLFSQCPLSDKVSQTHKNNVRAIRKKIELLNEDLSLRKTFTAYAPKTALKGFSARSAARQPRLNRIYQYYEYDEGVVVHPIKSTTVSGIPKYSFYSTDKPEDGICTNTTCNDKKSHKLQNGETVYSYYDNRMWQMKHKDTYVFVDFYQSIHYGVSFSEAEILELFNNLEAIN